MKKTTRVICLVVALVMVAALALVACDKPVTISKSEVSIKVEETVTLTATSPDGSEITWSSSNPAVASVGNDGTVTGVSVGEAVITATAGEKSATCKVTVAAKEYKDGDYWVNDTKSYTYRMGPSKLPTAWNVHTYQENMSTYVLDYISDSLYTMDYNADESGFRIVPSMASGDPVDVSAQYVGKFGITEGETGRAYKIPLKSTLKFDNGEAINANTFVRSISNLLNPKAANFRADNLWASGTLKIYGAEAYAKQGSTTFADVTKGEGVGTGKYVDFENISEELQKELYFSAADCFVGVWAKGKGYWGSDDAYFSSAAQCLANLLRDDDTAPLTTPLVQALEGKTLYEIKQDAEMNQTFEWLLSGWCTDPDEEFGFLCTRASWGTYDFSDVGFFAPTDHEIVIVLVNAMEDNFYLRYELCTSFFLVNNTKYEACISEEGGVYTNSYCTSVATTVGFGPYKLTEYNADNSMKLERNPYWHGYYELEHKDQYATTAVQYTVVNDDNLRLEMFLKGELDSYGLRADDMADYINSKYTYFNDSESTWFVAMNPDVNNYQTIQATTNPVNSGYAVVKTPIAIKEFRQALSYSLDRTGYILACNPTSGVGKSLMSVMQYYDPENGLSYRSTIEAKDAILNFWGLADAWGEGKEYADRDEAIDSITGYDPAGAKVLFTTAYNKAVEAGYITQEMIASGKWEVQVMLGSSSWSSKYSTSSFDFFNTNWTKAVEGTPFEGHLTFVKSGDLGQGYSDALRQGKVDMLFGVGFGGSMFDPYSFMDVFTGNLQYDASTDKKAISMDIEHDGKILRASLYDWVSGCLQGQEIVASVVVDGQVTSETVRISAGPDADVSLRLKIMANAEVSILNLSNMIPLMTDSSASLRCMRVVYKTEEYILGVGRGGIQYYTYTHDDAEFAAFVSGQGGTLNYKVSE